MFKNDDHGGAETTIGPSVHVEGDFVSQGNIHIDGAVTGTVKTTGNLTVGEQAKLTANVEAANAFVAGYLKGNLMVHERLELSTTSKIDGDISTKVLVVAEGAQLNGRCQMGNSVTVQTPVTSGNLRGNKRAPTPEVG